MGGIDTLLRDLMIDAIRFVKSCAMYLNIYHHFIIPFSVKDSRVPINAFSILVIHFYKYTLQHVLYSLFFSSFKLSFYYYILLLFFFLKRAYILSLSYSFWKNVEITTFATTCSRSKL